MYCKGKIRWRSHNTSDYLIEMVTKACFTVYTFGQYIIKVMFYIRLISSLSLYTIKLGTWCTKIHRFWMIDFSLHVTFLKDFFVFLAIALSVVLQTAYTSQSPGTPGFGGVHVALIVLVFWGYFCLFCLVFVLLLSSYCVLCSQCCQCIWVVNVSYASTCCPSNLWGLNYSINSLL